MKQLFLVLALITLLVGLGIPSLADSHCMDDLGCVEVSPDDPIVVGAMLTVSGATSFLGEEFARWHRDCHQRSRWHGNGSRSYIGR